MTGAEHYTAAEQHVDAAGELRDGGDLEEADFRLRLADVHATLAVAAATARNGADVGTSYDDAKAWRQATGPRVRRNSGDESGV